MNVAAADVVTCVVGCLGGRFLIVMEDGFLPALHRDTLWGFFDSHQGIFRNRRGNRNEDTESKEKLFHAPIRTEAGISSTSTVQGGRIRA